MKKTLFSTILLISAMGFAGERRPLLSIGAGFSNITGVHIRYQYQLEYKWKPVVAELRPFVGAFVTELGSTYVYGGVGYDFIIGKRVVLTPSFAPGIYFQGKGKDLGYPVEFRSGMELAYRFKREDRIGAMFYHVSNAHLSSRNPGVNVLVAFYAFPLGR